MENATACPLKCSKDIEVKSKCHKIIRNSLSELTLRCLNVDEGCAEVTRYDLFEAHIESCEYRLIECPAYEECRVKLPKSKIMGHTAACEYVEEKCDYCNENIKRI